MLKKLIQLLILVISSYYFTVACVPNSSNLSNTNNIDDYTTGKTVTIKPSDKNKKPEVVKYVNSGDKDLSNKVIETSLSDTKEKTAEVNANLYLRANIKSASLRFYKDGKLSNSIKNSKIILIIETISKNSSTYHKFITTEDHLTNVAGVVSRNKNTKPSSTKHPSSITANIDCQNEESCNKALVKLVIKKDLIIDGETRDYNITASIGITRKKAKVIIQNKSEKPKDKKSKIETVVEATNNSEDSLVEKIDIVIADGISYSEINIDDKIKMNIPITDSRKTDAQVKPDNVSVKGSKVEEVIFQGVSPSTGSIIVDVTTTDEQTQAEQTNDAITDEPIQNEQTDNTKKTEDRLLIITEDDTQLFEDGKINDNFNINEVKNLIAEGKATWWDVGVNPNTSLFFKNIENEDLLKKVLTQEAEFEALRGNPSVETYINKFKSQTCKHFIKNIAPVRTIISEAYLKSGISPTYAVNMRLESYYGLGASKQNIGKYDISVAKGCHTASGPFQINNGTYKSIIKRASSPSVESGYVGSLINNNNFEFIHRKAKVDFNPDGDGSEANPYFPNRNCEEVNQDIFIDDHRMFLESGAIIGSSFMAFNHSRYQHDAPLGFASYKQGPYRYFNKNRETRFKGLTLLEIDHFNMTTAGIDQRMQDKYSDGINYAYRAIALRSILTQPERYCENFKADEDSLSQLYSDSLEKLKDTEFQKELNLFHPNGKILEHSKQLTE